MRRQVSGGGDSDAVHGKTKIILLFIINSDKMKIDIKLQMQLPFF